MGAFDEVRIRYELPWPEVQRDLWQTNDTEAQWLDLYEIREDGTLWRKPATEFYISWQAVPYTGELECHLYVEHDVRDGPPPSIISPSRGWWYSVRFWFRDGVVKDVVCSKRDTGKKGGG